VAANAEEFLLKLNQQISGPATIAASALNTLEAQIRSEQGALAGLEGSLTSAKAKLVELEAAGAAGKAAGIEKQTSAVGDLAERLDYTKRQIEAIKAAGSGGDVGALAKLKSDAADLGAKLSEAKTKLTALETGGPKNAGAIDAQKAKIADLQGKSAGKGLDIAKLEGAVGKFKDLAAESKKGSSSLTELAEAAKGADGPVGKIANGFEKLKAAGAAGALVAVVVVLVAIAAAAVVAAFALTSFALAAADASRSSRLLANAASGVADGGEGMTRVIDDVANKSPLAREKIAELARAMEIAKLRGRDMQNALEATATASSAVGDAAGAAFKSIAERAQFARRFLLTKADLAGTGVEFAEVAASLAKAMGTSVAAATTLIQQGGVSVAKGLEAMNAAVQAKFGKTVAAQMLSVSTQMAKLKENFGRLFDGINIEPFLEGLKTITDLFSQNTVTGVALKTLFKSIFEPLAEASAGLFPIISAFMRGMVIAALSAYVAYLKVSAAIKEAFGGDSASKIDWIKTAMYAGMIAVVAIGAALTALVVIIALVAAGMIIMTAILLAPFILAAAAVYLLIAAFKWITTTLNDAVIGGFRSAGTAISGVFASIKETITSALGSIDLAGAAGHIIDSLVNGILGAVGKVSGAMKSVGSAILGALPASLQMHSPSVLLTRQAEMAAGSVVTPLEDAKDDARAAMEDLGSGRPDFSGAKPPGESSGGGSRVINFGPGSVVFNGEQKDFPLFRLMFAQFVEELSSEAPGATT
jgi:hypothetical protein